MVDILDIGTTNYKYTPFKSVDFIVRTTQCKFIKWVNEESRAEMVVHM